MAGTTGLAPARISAVTGRHLGCFGLVPINLRVSTIEPQGLEFLRPLRAWLEGNGHFLVVQRGFGEDHVVGELLGALELLVADLARHLAERAGKPSRNLRGVLELQIRREGTVRSRDDGQARRHRFTNEDIHFHKAGALGRNSTCISDVRSVALCILSYEGFQNGAGG